MTKQALSGHGKASEIERCPHCEEVLRIRGRWSSTTAKIVNDWLKEQAKE
jgi:NMD protein affecting ribosome stability and mRNA decay